MSNSSRSASIAIVGMACRLPGADDLDSFWTLLRDGRDAVREMPEDRLDRSRFFDSERGVRGRTYSTIGGLVADANPRSGDDRYNYCHRIFSDVAREAVRNSGMSPEELGRRDVGVFVGHSGGSPEFNDLTVSALAPQILECLDSTEAFLELDPDSRGAILGEALSRIRERYRRRSEEWNPRGGHRWAAELVARELGLTGPNFVVDAACSSSLVAIALGAAALDRGAIDTAIVGGASYAQINSLILFSQAQSCSARGSRPFDQGADGLVASEGYVALVLKSEERARADGDRILAVIRGIGISTDGRGRHLWAPRKEGQLTAMRRAYGEHVDPADIQYVEAHATSTQVGDATELESMVEFFGDRSGTPIPIGSVKSNIGHTLETAGLASVLKVVLAMQEGEIPPTLHVEEPNRSIDWKAVPFELVNELRPWPRPEGGVRKAAVSAFGIGGLNVHIVLEEPREGVPTEPAETAPSVEPIAIVGRGVVLPGAANVPAFAKLMAEGASHITAPPPGRWPIAAQAPELRGGRGGYIVDYTPDLLDLRIPPKQFAAANPIQFMLLDAAKQALSEAGTIERKETAVVVGARFAGDFADDLLLGMCFPDLAALIGETLSDQGIASEPLSRILEGFEERFFEAFPALIDETGGFTSSTLASRITKAFDLEGGALAIDAGSSSSLLALDTAVSLLRGGTASSVVCAAADRLMNLGHFEALRLAGWLDDPESAPGEGVAVLILRRLSDALRDGNPILGTILGTDARYDGGGDPSISTALHHAIKASGLSADRVDRATLANVRPSDLSRATSILAERLPNADADSNLPLRRAIGHLGGAQALVSIVHRTIDRPESFEAIHSVGDTGHIAAALLGPPIRRLEPGVRSVLRIGAPSIEELRERLLFDFRNPGEGFSDSDRFRIAILGSTTELLAARLAAARSIDLPTAFKSGIAESGIHMGEVATPRPRVAFLFPGQGSQHPGMLRDLVAISAAARRAMEDADRILASEGHASFADLAWSGDRGLNDDPVRTQLSILVADWIAYESLRELGIEPDLVCGHSFGEIPALVAARTLSLRDAVRLTIERASALKVANPEGGLLSIEGSEEEVVELLRGWASQLFITHLNAPRQTVVGGDRSELIRFARHLRDVGVRSIPLKVPGALHSPLVESACAPLRESLDRLELLPPTRLFYSNVTGLPTAEPEEIRRNLVAQIVQRQDYPSLVRRLMRDGVRVFVEVGPGHVLTYLNRQLLGSEALTLTSNPPRIPPREALLGLRAALECVGVQETRRGGSPEDLPSTGSPGGRIVEFDAFAVRREKNRERSAVAAEAEHPVMSGDTMEENQEITQLLLDIVVDLTGYPRQAIKLDWDLEADLGLDSIKRTQLVAELADLLHFDPQEERWAELGRVNTLGGIVEELKRLGALDGLPSPTVEAREPSEDPADRWREMGRRHRDEIRTALRRFVLEGTGPDPDGGRPSSLAELDPSFREEVTGIAEGAGVHAATLLAFHARTGSFFPQTQVLPSSPPYSEPVEDPLVVNQRYLLRMEEMPDLDGIAGRELSGRALVVGEGPTARGLADRLHSRGLEVLTMAAPASAEAVETFDRLWEEGPIHHLAFVMGDGPDPFGSLDSVAWSSRRDVSLFLPFRLCQRWVERGRDEGTLDRSSLLGITRMGGDFGISGRAESFDGGILPGLLKGILVEAWVAGFRKLAVRLIDAPSTEPVDVVVETALREWSRSSPFVEIGVRSGLSLIPVMLRQDAVPAEEVVRPRGNWICTGGGRGITAFVAEELARRYPVRLHLLGRTELGGLPPEWREQVRRNGGSLKVSVMSDARGRGEDALENWRQVESALEVEETLARLREAGVEAQYHACDISDRESLGRVLSEIRAEGPIEGVLHGAGYSRDAKIEQKTLDRVDRCFRAKVDGAFTLMDLTREDPLKHFIAFGSVSGRFGANGLADYSASNDMLAKMVDRYRRLRPEVRCVTFHWPPWGDVGMAMKPGAQLGLQRANLRFMAADVGVTHLLGELEANLPEGEVLIADPDYVRRFAIVRVEEGPDFLRLPLIDGPPTEDRNGSATFRATLDPVEDSFLANHRLDGRPLLPFVIGLELFAEAAFPQVATGLRLSNIRVLHGLRFFGNDPLQVTVLTRPVDFDRVEAELRADLCARDGTLLTPDRLLFQAVVNREVDGIPLASLPKGGGPAGPWTEIEYNPPGSRFFHGPPLQGLKRYSVGADGLWGEVVAPPISEFAGSLRPGEGWRVHGPLLDACLYAVGILAWGMESVTAVPMGMDELWVGRFPNPGERCLVEVSVRGRTEERGFFDFRTYGADGSPLFEARGYAIAWIRSRVTTE